MVLFSKLFHCFFFFFCLEKCGGPN